LDKGRIDLLLLPLFF